MNEKITLTKDFIQSLPKAELHLHIEGALEPELLFELAARNGVDLPYASVEALRQAYNFSNLQEFLDLYYQGMSVLQTEQDYFDLTWAYLERSKKDHVTHVEIFFDPQGHTERGVSFETVITGIYRALQQGEADLGISFRLIMSFLRHLSEEEAFKTWDEAQPFMHMIAAVGLDSSEMGHPPSKFINIFKVAKDAGLKLVAHAGEEGPPAYVYEALDLLKIDRLDHGNRAMEDADLVARLVKDNMTLTVCPLSNHRLCVVEDLRDHPLVAMLEAGLSVTINSDDPAYFGGYLNENFNRLHEACMLDGDHAIALVKNSFTGSFLDKSAIKKHLDEIDHLAKKLRA
jgi:adenosine deaminase